MKYLVFKGKVEEAMYIHATNDEVIQVNKNTNKPTQAENKKW